MARLLGRIAIGHHICCCLDCGNDSSHTRTRKRQEARELEREFAVAASFYDRAEGKQWLELGLAEAEGWPLYDLSDCQHGCNGDCVESGSERCDFTCHEQA